MDSKHYKNSMPLVSDCLNQKCFKPMLLTIVKFPFALFQFESQIKGSEQYKIFELVLLELGLGRELFCINVTIFTQWISFWWVLVFLQVWNFPRKFYYFPVLWFPSNFSIIFSTYFRVSSERFSPTNDIKALGLQFLEYPSMLCGYNIV